MRTSGSNLSTWSTNMLTNYENANENAHEDEHCGSTLPSTNHPLAKFHQRWIGKIVEMKVYLRKSCGIDSNKHEIDSGNSQKWNLGHKGSQQLCQLQVIQPMIQRLDSLISDFKSQEQVLSRICWDKNEDSVSFPDHSQHTSQISSGKPSTKRWAEAEKFTKSRCEKEQSSYAHVNARNWNYLLPLPTQSEPRKITKIKFDPRELTTKDFNFENQRHRLLELQVPVYQSRLRQLLSSTRLSSPNLCSKPKCCGFNCKTLWKDHESRRKSPNFVNQKIDKLKVRFSSLNLFKCEIYQWIY